MLKQIAMLQSLETGIIDRLDEALDHGLGTQGGRDALQSAMRELNTTAELKSELIYSPLLEDPATRDYIRHLDFKLYGLIERIEVLRSYLELSMQADTPDADMIELTVHRLRRRLLVLFKKESALRPVYSSWVDRHAPTAGDTARLDHAPTAIH
ncbi:hypothetical protein [Maricaulis sp.]|uniref:hypothetical protein n=1 Tax=unclassified Maricaulis TaxID=2632371 RepID=UPI001B2A5ADA|nr:hypothetical protein [Maricaulis sp.]MBO6796460.1 hypothetical protein [Maricaulis sp.]